MVETAWYARALLRRKAQPVFLTAITVSSEMVAAMKFAIPLSSIMTQATVGLALLASKSTKLHV
jgi:hypothetical protein